jgi:hypothetical protein
MKSLNWIARIAAVVAIMFIANSGRALAEDAIRQPTSIVPTNYEYDYYADTAPAQPAAPAAAAPTTTPETTDFVATNATEPCPAPVPWQLPQPCFFQRNNIKMGGWVEQGITFNNLNPEDRYNGPNALNDRDKEYQLNQAWLYFDRPTNTGGCGWDLGGHVDLMYGTDWRYGQSYGLENRFNSANSFYGFILPQFYADVAVNDLTVRLGHFASNTTLEQVPAVANFFYSHVYMMSGYFDPLLVTGLQASYKLSDNFTVIGGMNRGWEEFEDPNSTWNFLGGVKWVDNDKRQTLSLMLDSGDMLGMTRELHQRNSVYMVYTCNLTERWQYGAQYNLGQEVNGSFVTPGQNANWYGTEQLLTYKINQKWSAGIRYEWVRDEEGSRIAGLGNVLLTDRGWNGQPGFTGSFQDISLGLNYRPNSNIVIRPETRWDSYDGPVNVAGELPYGNHTRSSQFTFACDLIVTF